jgi:hypothetical protein
MVGVLRSEPSRSGHQGASFHQERRAVVALRTLKSDHRYGSSGTQPQGFGRQTPPAKPVVPRTLNSEPFLPKIGSCLVSSCRQRKLISNLWNAPRSASASGSGSRSIGNACCFRKRSGSSSLQGVRFHSLVQIDSSFDEYQNLQDCCGSFLSQSIHINNGWIIGSGEDRCDWRTTAHSRLLNLALSFSMHELASRNPYMPGLRAHARWLYMASHSPVVKHPCPCTAPSWPTPETGR